MQPLVQSKQLVLLGITQEQHSERCQLFAQWKQFDWPILHDPINLLESSAVPIVVAIDEHGIVRQTRPTPSWVKETFVKTDYAAPRAATEPTSDQANLSDLQSAAETEDSFLAWQQFGDAAVLWGGNARLNSAVQAYTRALQRKPDDAMTHFRLGVALRSRYESPHRQEADFQQAVDHWTEALALDPNQYIWRRRIQQYGPRLIKPYPFYGWIDQARKEIAKRGDTPIPLPVNPSGAEIAQPSKGFTQVALRPESPDPEGKITRDAGKYVRIATAVVPAKIKPGESVCLHLDLRPTEQVDWNNEAEPLRVWIEPPADWQLERPLLEFTAFPNTVESKETRRLEVELLSPKLAANNVSVQGYALYYVCRKSDGTCLLRRQEFQLDLPVFSRK